VWLIGCAAIGTAYACGPDFPLMLMKCREVCLAQMMALPFQAEILRLDDPAQTRRADERATLPSRESTVAAEGRLLPPGDAEIVAQMRAAASGDEAYALGAGLPEAVRLYTAGAVDFLRVVPKREWAPELSPGRRQLTPSGLGVLERAIERFEAIMALAPGERAAREVWAAFMLGRSYYERNAAGDEERASREFRKAIDLVRRGAEDPLGLANAALGELGWLAFEQRRTGEAVEWYAQQQSDMSLLEVARTMFHAPERMQEWLADARTQRLLAAYIVHRADTTCVSTCYLNEVITDSTREVIDVALREVATLRPRQVELPDRWAALAYAVGNYDLAETLAANAQSGYAAWIRAKLALHKGDMAAAEAAFAEASRSFPAEVPAPAEYSLPGVVQRFNGEQAILRLARGEYVEALNQLMSAETYWLDIEFIGERVLTVDELKSFVDALPEPPPSNYTAPARVRDILARRLARAGRYQEAQRYYLLPATREFAASYVEARAVAERGSTPLAQARGWYDVARLEVVHGWELRAASGNPDRYPYDIDAISTFAVPSQAADELARTQASAVVPDRRYHYRQVGIDSLMQAADRLPPKSPAFAALLCQGASWLFRSNQDSNRDLIDKVYLRYVREGRAEPWAADFGRDCPEPQFE